MLNEKGALPPIRLISLGEGVQTTALDKAPSDLRCLRVEEFLSARSLAPNSRKAYQRELQRFLDWTDRSWKDITPRQLVQFKEHLKAQGLAPTSVNRALAAVKSFFSWLDKAYPHALEFNPAPAVAMEKVPEPEARDLLPAEVQALQQALKTKKTNQLRDQAIFAVLAHGLRASEVCDLNVGDFDGVRLRIRKAKDDSTGTVPLLQKGREELNRYLELRRGVEGSLQSQSPLFLTQGPNSQGQRVTYRAVYHLFIQLQKASGLEDVSPHRLRHTFATELLLRGMESEHAMALTRHRSRATFQRYAKRARAAAAEQAFYAAMEEEPPR